MMMIIGRWGETRNIVKKSEINNMVSKGKLE
jgi:hypothetical protein